MSTKPYLKKAYLEKVVPELIKARGYKNVHQVPNLTKIVLNSAFKADADKAHMAEVVKEITKLSGQKPIITYASKSVASFKVREGMPLGCVVTLRGARMWEFMLRLTAVALPMIRDFRGVGNRLDGRGNFSLGIVDHTIFPETQADGSQRANIGMDVVIVTTATNDDEGRELLRMLGMPFRRSSAATEAAAATAKA
ncbi:MAG: 50S ribosomal protein L5 [Opitutales bacterium]|nr:50S ribosomal protein L5 [Opitutales bacterium]